MIFHYMKDGTRRDSIDGYIVKYEQKKNLYKALMKKEKRLNDNEDTRKNIREK